MLNIALFGSPGAGKGTQSKFLIKKYNLYYISTGDILRNEIKKKTELGKEADRIISQGQLVPDEIILKLIEGAIINNPNYNGFLFDGFPRTYVQAYILEGLLLNLNTSLDCLINIDISNKVAAERLINRGKTSKRSDDNAKIIKNRLKEYKEKTLPVLQFYKEKNIYHGIVGDCEINLVKSKIISIIKKELSKRLFNVVVFGYPGSGRSSQGKALAKKFGLEYVSTGEMLESEIEKRTLIGKKVKDIVASGLPVPDRIVVQLIERKLKKYQNVKGFLFKGFPRTLVQSYILDGLLKKIGSSISKIIYLDVSAFELMDRLGRRKLDPEHSPYDVSTVRIVQRMKDHEKSTEPVIEKANRTHDVKHIDGGGTFEEVFKKTSEIIDTALKSVR